MTFILKTQRLYLREMTEIDAENAFRLNSDPDVMRYTGDELAENVQQMRVFLANYDAFAKYKMGRWAVIVAETEEWLGWCGLKYHPETDEVDLGYRLLKSAWGKGYATEAAKICLIHGFETLGLKRIYAEAVEENTASTRVMQKLGMTLTETRRTCAGYPSVIYEIFAPDTI